MDKSLFPITYASSVHLDIQVPMLSVDTACAFAFSLGREGLTSDHLELNWTLLPWCTISFVFSGLTEPEGITPAKDLRNHPHATWWSYGPWAGERVKTALVRAWTETDDCRCDHCGIACGTRHVRVRWRNFCVYEQVTSPQWRRWSTRTIETFATASTARKHS